MSKKNVEDFKLMEMTPGVFVYVGKSGTASRYICPPCYESKGKVVTLRYNPAQKHELGDFPLSQTPSSLTCTVKTCNFRLEISLPEYDDRL